MISDPVTSMALIMALVAFLTWLSEQPSTAFLFRFLPPIIWCYFLSLGLSESGMLSGADNSFSLVSALLAPFAIFLLTTSTSLKDVSALDPRLLFMMVGASLATIAGLTVSYGIFAKALDPEIWRGLAAIGAGWIGGSGNLVAIAVAVDADPSILGPLTVADSVVVYFWLSVTLALAGRQVAMDRRIFTRRSELAVTLDAPAASEDRGRLTARIVGIVLGVGALVTVLAIAVGEILAEKLDIGLSPSSWALLTTVTVAIPISFTGFRKDSVQAGAPIATYCFYLLIAMQGAMAEFGGMSNIGIIFLVIVLALFIHIFLISLIAYFLRQDSAIVAISSWAAIGGAVTAPIVAHAYRPALVPVAVIMALANYVMANYMALILAKTLQYIAL